MHWGNNVGNFNGRDLLNKFHNSKKNLLQDIHNNNSMRNIDIYFVRKKQRLVTLIIIHCSFVKIFSYISICTKTSKLGH